MKTALEGEGWGGVLHVVNVDRAPINFHNQTEFPLVQNQSENGGYT